MTHCPKLHTPFRISLSFTHLHTYSECNGQTDGQTDTELYTSAEEGTLPLGLVTMLFLVLLVWGCAGNTKCFISAQQQQW